MCLCNELVKYKACCNNCKVCCLNIPVKRYFLPIVLGPIALIVYNELLTYVYIPVFLVIQN